MPAIPLSQGHVYTVVTEEALGLPASDRPTLVALVAELPFELATILVSRLQGELVHIRTDAHAQLELAAIIFEDVGTLNGIEAFPGIALVAPVLSATNSVLTAGIDICAGGVG